MTTPKHPYVKFFAKWTTLKDGNQVDDFQEMFFNVERVHNASEETINNLRRKGWKVLGYGNFPNNAHYKDFANYLDNMTGLRERTLEEDLRAKIIEEINSSGGIVPEQVRARKAKKIEQVEAI